MHKSHVDAPKTKLGIALVQRMHTIVPHIDTYIHIAYILEYIKVVTMVRRFGDCPPNIDGKLSINFPKY